MASTRVCIVAAGLIALRSSLRAGDAKTFASAREFAAFLGLVPGRAAPGDG